ncbi:MAG TPA: tetratricopeptide repeat protein [Nitrospiraceae bacterium]|nr:tetratricopeptide repeat protein [Nitrospiraceae bacterium]
MKTNVRAFLAPLAFCAAALIVYAGAFHGDFHYDDSLTILENPHLLNWHTFIGHLDHMVRPVLYATFLIDHSLYGPDPAGYHLLNLLLHLGSGLLIYRIVTSAVRDERSSVPFWIALVFLIHPIATETVTYISGRASGLMTFLYLLAFFLYLKASEQHDNGTFYWLCLSGAVASFLLSIGSKESAVTLPVILLLWDMAICKLNGSSLRTIVIGRHLPFWIVLFLAAGWAWSHPRYTALAEFSFTIRPFWDHLLSEVHAMAYAIALLFTPWNQNFDHDLPAFHSLTQWPLPLDLLLLSAVAAGIFFSARRLPLVAFGLSWFFIQLLPTSLIPRNDLLSERNLYLPAIGLLVAIVVLGSHLSHWLLTIVRQPAFVRFGSSVLVAGLIATLGFFTYQRNLLYQDRLLLWSDAVAKSPNKARPHNNLGYAYALRDDWDHAIEEFRMAARLDPDFILAQQNLRDAYLRHVGRQ